MAETPEVELIIENLQTTLEAINGAGLYTTKVLKVTRDVRNPTEGTPEDWYPLIVLLEGSIVNVMTRGTRVTHDLEFEAEGWLKEPIEEATTIQTQLNQLARDIETALMQDPRRGNREFVSDTRVIRIDPPRGQGSGMGFVRIQALARFHRSETAGGGHGFGI